MLDDVKLKWYQKKGYEALNKFEHEKAIEYFEKAIMISDSPEIVFNYIIALSGLSRYEEAHTMLENILKEYDQNEVALSMMTWVCLMLRKWDEAKMYCGALRLSCPTNKEFAHIYDILEDEKGRETFVRVNDMIKRAEVCKIRKDYAQAIQLLESAKDLDPRNGLIYHNIGIIYHIQKNKAKAIEYLQKAIEVEPLSRPFKKSLNKINR